jgi:hypothetical protein
MDGSEDQGLWNNGLKAGSYYQRTVVVSYKAAAVLIMALMTLFA